MRLLLAFSSVAVALAACAADIESFASRVVTEDERRFSDAYLRLLQSGDIDSAYAQLVPELRTAEGRAQLAGTVDILRGVSLDSLVLIGVNVSSVGNQRHVNLSYEVAASNGFVVTNVATRREDNSTGVEGFSARPVEESLLTANSFTLEGRGPAHFLWLAMLVAMPAICVLTAILIARTSSMPKRWLWVVVSLVAAPVFALNWTSGGWELRPFSFTLLGGGFVRGGPAAPWILSFGLPLGAALALWQRARWRRRAVESGSGEAAV